MNQNSKIQIVVVPELCPQNHICPALKACAFGALTQKGFAAPVIDQIKCTKCGKCTKVCPRDALQIVREQTT